MLYARSVDLKRQHKEKTMGRPLNKRYFGAGAGNQIKVRAKIGANAEGDGVIVSQRGSKKFKVTVGGNTGDCFLVDKADGSLGANEMSITVLTDNGVLRRVTKIAAHRVTTAAGSFAWNFADSATDGAVQMEEVEAGVAAPVITITAQPANTTVTAPAAATFSVTATVTQGATLQYLWEVSADGNEPWTSLPTTTATLTIDPTALEDNGKNYRVTVYAVGVAGVTSNAATLTVTE